MSLASWGTFIRLLFITAAMTAAVASISHWMPSMAPLPLPVEIPSPNAELPRTVNLQPAYSPPGPVPQLIRRVNNPDRQIALTFDACATRTQPNGFDRAVFRLLQQKQVPATIFVSGSWVKFHPTAMQELATEPLMEFANHAFNHPHMDRLRKHEIAHEIDRTEQALRRYGRQSVAFRPPFGDFNDLVLKVAHERHLSTVLWDVVSGDPSQRITAEEMIRSVVRDTRAGSIIIFHINARGSKTAAALPAILQQLRDRGFQFVFLSTLLAKHARSPLAQTHPDGNDDALMSLLIKDAAEMTARREPNATLPPPSSTPAKGKRFTPIAPRTPKSTIGPTATNVPSPGLTHDLAKSSALSSTKFTEQVISPPLTIQAF